MRMIVQVPIEAPAYPDTVPSAERRDMPGETSTMDERVAKLWSLAGRLSPVIVIERIADSIERARSRVRADRSQHRQ